jgi:uncharacterized SAM-binding protein YcdF (DUF218 family)
MRRLKPPGLFRRLLSLVLLAWLLGFLWFALFLPRPADATHTDAVIALTGGNGRIARGLDVLRAGQARRLLVSGVDSQVAPAHFASEYGVPAPLFSCCVTLGYESFDTRSNAHEAAAWIARHDIRSVRLVTTDWHMRRAAFDLKIAAPAGLVVVEDAVPSHPAMKVLFLEYNKYLARIAAWLIDWPAPRTPAGTGHRHG